MYLPRQRTKVRKTFQREAEARSWRADALSAANRGALRPAPKDTRAVAEALTQFIDEMKAGAARPKGKARYKPATTRSYEQAVRRYIEPSDLGGMRITEVQRSDVQALADELLAAGLDPATISNVLNPLQTFFRRAEDRGLLAHNPALRIDLPVGGASRPRRIASPGEATALIAALPERDRPLWATAFYAGLRRGELQALRWSDVDLGASLIRVERSWDQYEGPIQPKSASSCRTVPLLALLRDHLDEHKLRIEHHRDQLVFGRTGAHPFAAMTISKRSRKAWEAVGLEPITLHDCRHTFASLLIDAGANPKAVQTFMGHSKIQTTFDIYGHLMPGSRDEVRARMDAYLASPAAVSS